MLPDIFGWQSNAGRLMGIADTLADQGYRVLLSAPRRNGTRGVEEGSFSREHES